MSKIALTPNASGSGTFTIASPNSDTDRTLTLPDEAGTVLTSGTTASSIPGYGNLTMVDQWYLDTSSSGNVDPILNWTRVGTSDGGGSIGSAMTEASGVFTFPETGIYRIEFTGMLDANVFSRYNVIEINTTTDGSTFAIAARSSQFVDTGSTFGSVYITFIFDVQNTSTHKVRFGTSFADGTVALVGGTTRIDTGVYFTRLGDT